MNPLSEKNVFSSFFESDRADKIVESINNNIHCAFEFEYGCGEPDFRRLLLERLKKEPCFLFHMDLSMVTGPDHLAKRLSRAYAAAFAGDLKRIESAMAKLIPTATTKIVIGETEEPYIDFEYGTDTHKLLSNLFDFPEIAGMEENRHSVVVWSDFDRLNGILREEGMRVFINKGRGHAITSHVMTGRGISGTAKKLSGAMANQVQVMKYSEIVSREQINGYIRDAFAQYAVVPEKVIEAIYEYADGRIELIKKICAAISRSSDLNESLTLEKTAETVGEMILNADLAYKNIWNNLNNRQKSALNGISSGDVQNIYSESFIKKYGFGTATNLQAALRGLQAKSVLGKHGRKWAFTDPFFRLWIRLSSGIGL